MEQRAAAEESRPPFALFSQVSLRGCHQSLMPTYRLPQHICQIRTLDELGMARSTSAAAPTAELNNLLQPGWTVDQERLYVTGFEPLGSEHPATYAELISDAMQWALSFCRDFRALHQFNHDHDCTSTCIKYVKKGKEAAEDALRKGWVVACRFFYFHIVVFTYMCELAEKIVTKRIRRRGKKLVKALLTIEN